MNTQQIELIKRPRRNRKSAAIRSLVQETYLLPHQLVSPLFVMEAAGRQPIASMPGVERLSIDHAVKAVLELYSLGIRAVELFPVISSEKKDSYATEATRQNNIIQQSVRAIKSHCPDICVMVDIALDPFTDHGHDGIADQNTGYILNDATLERLGEMAVIASEAGADIVAPSDMMDGRVAYIRKCLDDAGFINVNILSYAAKFASSFYGPFREALSSTLKFGDKKSYQLNPANSREALLEMSLDEQEGADILMVKPAIAYLDIIAKARAQTDLPICAYHVSGEYAMVMAAAEKGWIDGDRVMMESLLSIKRAGADFILTYAARRMAEILGAE